MGHRKRTTLSLQETLIREFAGAPARVAMNMLATGFAGVLFGHCGLGAAMSAPLVLNAMLVHCFALGGTYPKRCSTAS